jgi:hypothetical protein
MMTKAVISNSTHVFLYIYAEVNVDRKGIERDREECLGQRSEYIYPHVYHL